MRMYSFLLFVYCVAAFCPAHSVLKAEDLVPASESDYVKVMDQRASFFLDGQVVDQDGQPLDDVELVATLCRYDHSKQSVREEEKTFRIDGSFNLALTNVTAVILEAKKDGYSTESLTFKQLDIMKRKKKEMSKELAAGQISSKSVKSRPYAPYLDLVERKSGLRIVLEHTGTRILGTSDKTQLLAVSENQPRSSCTFCEDHSAVSASLSIVMELDDTGAWQYILEAPEGFGILLGDPNRGRKDSKKVPRAGYQKRAVIEPAGMSTLVSFWLKTPSGHYVKSSGLLTVDSKKNRARLEILKSVIYTDDDRHAKNN